MNIIITSHLCNFGAMTITIELSTSYHWQYNKTHETPSNCLSRITISSIAPDPWQISLVLFKTKFHYRAFVCLAYQIFKHKKRLDWNFSRWNIQELLVLFKMTFITRFQDLQLFTLIVYIQWPLPFIYQPGFNKLFISTLSFYNHL